MPFCKCLEKKETTLAAGEVEVEAVPKKIQASAVPQTAPQTTSMKRGDSKPAKKEEESDEEDGIEVEVEKSSYETLVDMFTQLIQSAASYLLPEEQDEYEKQQLGKIDRMNSKQLREQIIAGQNINEAVQSVMNDEEVEEEDVAKAQRESLRVANGTLKFDGDHFAKIIAASLDESTGLVNAERFLQAANAVPLLMGGLGRTFEFASSDLIKKLQTAQTRMEETAQDLGIDVGEVTLQDMIERDIRNKSTHAGKKAAGASRTILRLMWFLDFIGALLSGVARNPDQSLKTICSKVYEDTLAPRHAWILRKAARSGMGLLPNKEVFRKRLGTDNLSHAQEAAKLEIWSESVTKVAEVMWAYMKSKGLEELP